MLEVTAMFSEYVESGHPLLADGSRKISATFRLKNSNVTFANALRRAILTMTPSVGFRTEPHEKSEVQISINTTPLVNEMIAHRIGMIPINIPDVAAFQPEFYEFRCDIKNTTSEMVDVRAGDIQVFKTNPEAPLEPSVQLDSKLFFPPDPVTGDTILITRLRPQWNPTAPKEQLAFKARASVSNGMENIRWSPVCQSSYEYTLDQEPAHLKAVFEDWLLKNKKIADPATLPGEQLEALQREFNTMEIQRCYLTDKEGNPNDFTFHVETIGVQSVQQIVGAAFQALEGLVSKYMDIDVSLPESVAPIVADTRYAAIDVRFQNEGHTLGNLLESYIGYEHMTGLAEPRVSYVAYKVPHPLRPEMFVRVAINTTTDIEAMKLQALAVVANTCRTLKRICSQAGAEWEAMFVAPQAAVA